MSTASLGSERTDGISPVSVVEAEPDPAPTSVYEADAIPPAAPSAVSPYRWIILIGLISAVIMEALDTTIINVNAARIRVQRQPR